MKPATFIIARLMPIWIVIFSIWAINKPTLFINWGNATGPALGLVLFIMGLTLDRRRLSVLIQRPKVPLLGSLGKWILASLPAKKNHVYSLLDEILDEILVPAEEEFMKGL